MINTEVDFAVKELLFEIRKHRPELRICQIFNIAAFKAGWKDNDLFYCPDEMILKGLELLRGEEM